MMLYLSGGREEWQHPAERRRGCVGPRSVGPQTPCAADGRVAAHVWKVTVVERESDRGTIMP